MSEPVQRYSRIQDGIENRGSPVPDEHGYFVRYEDYAALLAERDALAKDAARYRWLREPVDVTKAPSPLEIMYWDDTGPDHISGNALDAAIDARLL